MITMLLPIYDNTGNITLRRDVYGNPELLITFMLLISAENHGTVKGIRLETANTSVLLQALPPHIQ